MNTQTNKNINTYISEYLKVIINDSSITGGSREIFNQENKTILSKILLKQYNYEEMRFILDYMESIKKNIYNNPNIQGYIYYSGSSKSS